MNIKNLVIILLALGLVFVSYKWASSTGQTPDSSPTATANASTGASTQPDGHSGATASTGQLRPFDVTDDWHENPFDFFKGSGLLLAVGDSVSSNAMTIGWGSLGNVWSKLGPATVTVYVAEARYTFGFMERARYFTVMAFDREFDAVLNYMGTHSGRDGDKASAMGLHTLYTEHGTPYYAEASLVLECEILYRAPFERKGMSKDVADFYANFPAGVHHMYIGNIVTALKK